MTQSKHDSTSPLDKPLDFAEIDKRMREEAPFMNPPIDRFDMLDEDPKSRSSLKRKLAVGALAIATAAGAGGLINRAVDGTQREHADLAQQAKQRADAYFKAAHPNLQGGLDAQGNRIVLKPNGEVRQVISKAELEQASGSK